MSKRVPRFKEIVMNERDKETNDPLVWCRDDDGEVYMLQLDEAMLIPFALALLSGAGVKGRLLSSPGQTVICTQGTFNEGRQCHAVLANYSKK